MAADADNAWRMLPDDWQRRIASRVQRFFWKKHAGKTSSFTAWCQQWYPGLVKAGSRPPTLDLPRQERALRAVFPEWWFTHDLDTRERNSLLCVLTKLRVENLVDWVEDVTWVGKNCEIDFVAPRGAEVLHRHLLEHGYGEWWFAKKSGSLWGVRSRFQGVQLHFRGWSDTVQAHIDSLNPGDPATGEATGGARELGAAIDHKIADDWHRSLFDDPAVIWPLLNAQAAPRGIVLPWVR